MNILSQTTTESNNNQGQSLCNPTDHVLYGYCQGCPEVRQIKENGLPWEGYAEYLDTYRPAVRLTPEIESGLCGCHDVDSDQCALIGIGATYGQRRFKNHIDYTPCGCLCHPTVAFVEPF